MHKQLVIGLCILFVGSGVRADDPFSLWQVDGDANTVYLLGSVHLLREQDHPLPSRIDDAYLDAEILYMEIDMDDIDPMAAQIAINQLGVLRGEETLASLIGADAFSAALTAAEKSDIPLEMLSRSEPWLAAMTVEQMMLVRLGFKGNLGVESTMLERATADAKPIYGFETLEEQLGFLDTLSLDAQRDMLLQALQDSHEAESMMNDLVAAWRNGDTDYFERSVLPDLRELPELYDVILAQRNYRWVEKIDTLLDDDKDYLIIVGVLHLVGEDGVPTLLEHRGHQVSQLTQE